MFKEHGDFIVTLDENILLVSVSGAWNAETAKAYAEVVIETINPIKYRAWGVISDVREWELCTPDCKVLIAKLSAKCKGKGMKREAIINSNTESVKLDLFRRHTIKQSSKALPDAFERCFFETEKEAREWLNDEGYGLA